MRSLWREHGVEALIGVVVVALAAWFVWFALARTGGSGRADAIRVSALFPNASGVNVGTDVRIAGLKVGTVAAQKLDPQSFQVDVTMAIDPTVKVPNDSSAVVATEGLLGGTFVSLQPGGSTTPFKTGDTILETQGALDINSLIGQFVNRSGSSGSGAGAPADSAAAPAGKP